MTVLLEKTFERTLDRLVADYATPANRGGRLEAWVFEEAEMRQAGERRFAEHGVTARIRSAYKPLVHAFFEEINLEGVEEVRVTYPLLGEMPRRFRLEAYPLAALVAPARLVFTEGEAGGFTYRVALVRADGRSQTFDVFAPNRAHTDPIGMTVTSPTGWLKWTGPDGDTEERRLETDYEALFSAAADVIARHPWGEDEPYFEALSVRAELPVRDRPLSHGHESISLCEALHEDLYFSALEIFQKKSGRPLGDRGLRPGQIVPEVLNGEGAPRLRVEARALQASAWSGPEYELDSAPAAIGPGQVGAVLDSLGDRRFTARSRAGRIVEGLYRPGTDPAVMISGGQHANETSGVIGALRAAKRLAGLAEAHFAVSPLENPDGYALHHHLCAAHPAHMHHAARYTAFGNDLEFEPEPTEGAAGFEKDIRRQAEALCAPKLHVNLHGYPAHEWTRPLTGYVPRGFEMWTIPKGFFLVLRHHPDWREQAYKLIASVTAHLDGIRDLREFNESQISLFEIHAGEAGFRIVNGFPCLISSETRHAAPLTLITEYPDETITGTDFAKAHTAQMETVLGAYYAFREMM